MNTTHLGDALREAADLIDGLDAAAGAEYGPQVGGPIELQEGDRIYYALSRGLIDSGLYPSIDLDVNVGDVDDLAHDLFVIRGEGRNARLIWVAGGE